MSNIPKPEDEKNLEFDIRYQPDMVLSGSLDATEPAMNYLQLSLGDEVYDLNRQLPDYSEANDGDVLQIASGEPTWGAVDGLPEIEETDEGKVLAVDQGEAVWADAPSGLPEITNADEGKVLTVVEGTEEVIFIPEQTVTTALGDLGYSSVLSNVPTPLSEFSIGDEITLTVQGTEFDDGTYTLKLVDQQGISAFYAEGALASVVYYQNQWIIILMGSDSVTGTVSATREVSGDLSAQWAEPSGGGGGGDLYMLGDTGSGVGLYKIVNGAPVQVKYGDIANKTFIAVAEQYAAACMCMESEGYLFTANVSASMGTKAYLISYMGVGSVATDDVINVTRSSVEWTVTAST